MRLSFGAKSKKSTIEAVAELFGLGSAEYVVAHTERQRALGKSAAMGYNGVLNPRLALEKAQNDAETNTTERLFTALSSVEKPKLTKYLLPLLDFMEQEDISVYNDSPGATRTLCGYLMPVSDCRIALETHYDITNRGCYDLQDRLDGMLHEGKYPYVVFSSGKDRHFYGHGYIPPNLVRVSGLGIESFSYNPDIQTIAFQTTHSPDVSDLVRV